MTVIHLICPQGVGSEVKEQALVRLNVLPTFVWGLGTSKGHIAYLRLLRVDFYKDQPGCYWRIGDWRRAEAGEAGGLCPWRTF